jgi:hypothetical protein
MIKRPVPLNLGPRDPFLGEPFPIAAALATIADQRTEVFLTRMLRFDLPLRQAIRAAYFQGMVDFRDASSGDVEPPGENSEPAVRAEG